MKKLFALLLALVMLASLLSACGGETGSRDDNKDEDPMFASLAMAHKEAGEYDEAIADFEKALEADGEDTDSYLELADIYIRQHEFQKAYDILTLGYEKTKAYAIEDKLLEFNSANVIEDSDGLLHGKSFISGDQLVWCHVYGYENGIRTSISRYDDTGSQTHTVSLTYNEAGKPTTAYAYYSNTGILEKVELEYNEAGQLCKTTEYDENGNYAGYSVNSFDADGYKVGEIRYDADGNVHWELRYTHDVEKMESVCECYFYGVKVGTTTATYSESGYTSSSSSRFQGARDREISYDIAYGGDHEREEFFESEESYVRVICYNARLEDLY